MNDPIEAAGDVLTGGIVAAAVEPAGSDHAHRHGVCLNCATALVGGYCHGCGQSAHVHRSLGGLWHDIAHGVFHFEGKVWRTLPMLAWRPGELTRRYVHGERARFVSPLALFLFSVFLMFAVFESVGGPIRSTPDRQVVNIDTKSVAVALDKARGDVRGLEAQRAGAIAAGRSVGDLDVALETARAEVDQLTGASALLDGTGIDKLPEGVSVNTGSKALDERVIAAFKNPRLLLYKLQSSAYKFAWALIPLSLPFTWLLFAWRRKYRLYDHAVFITYSLSSVILLLIGMALLASMGGPTEWALLLVPVHFYRQLKGAYQLRRFSALWRTVALLFVASTVLLIFGLALLALGVTG